MMVARLEKIERMSIEDDQQKFNSSLSHQVPLFLAA